MFSGISPQTMKAAVIALAVVALIGGIYWGVESRLEVSSCQDDVFGASNERPGLTAEQQAAFDEKDAYLRSIGQWRPPAEASARPGEVSVRTTQEEVHISKAELERILEQEMAANRENLGGLRELVGDEEAERIFEEHWAPRIAEVEAVPESGRDAVVQMVELGNHLSDQSNSSNSPCSRR